MATDPTFRSYKPAQAQLYAGSRPAYPPVLYEHIFSEHASTGGQFGFVVDVGCGPGSATRDLAPTFEHAVGLDPGQEMLNVAREKGGETKIGEKIRYEVSEAEKIASVAGLPKGGVDMITASTAAHWFDMKLFWEQAAQLLRPGGSVALWIRGVYYAHPDMPYAARINSIQDDFQTVIDPYLQPGNRLAHDLYDDLLLPWQTDVSQTAFPKDKFERFVWDRDGRDGTLSDPEGKDFFGGSKEFPLIAYEHALGTVSAVTRWREAHSELVGTDKDVVKVVIARMKEVVGEGGLRGGGPTALLFFKKAE